MKKANNLIWGIILVVVGVIFGLNALNITNFTIFFKGWWTLFIIIPSVVGLIKDKDKTGNIIGIIIGTCLLLATRGLIDFNILWKLLVPTIIVIIGLSLIFKDIINTKINKKIQTLNKNDQKEYYATFASNNLDFSNEEFDGGELNAVFGGIKCDLRDAKLKEETLITINSIFGGVTLYLPKDTNVKITSVPLFGGVSNERKNKSTDSKNTIYIKATCMFGGVEIK